MENKKGNINQFGFTFIEVLAVIVVIGILTLVSFLVFQGKRDSARATTAYLEMKKMAEAETEVEGYYGYFVPLSVLNDVSGNQADYPGVTNPDCIGELPFSTPYYIIDPETGVCGTTVGTIRYTMLKDNSHKWQGPFITYQRQIPLATGGIFAGMPVDPWGGPYWLVSRQRYSINYQGVSDSSYSIDSLDRFAIVSWGKDSTPYTADDLIYTFR